MVPSCPRADVPYPPVCFSFRNSGPEAGHGTPRIRHAQRPVPVPAQPGIRMHRPDPCPFRGTARVRRHSRDFGTQTGMRRREKQVRIRVKARQVRQGPGYGPDGRKREKTAWPKRFFVSVPGRAPESLWDDCKTPQIDGIMIPQKPRNVKGV